MSRWLQMSEAEYDMAEATRGGDRLHACHRTQPHCDGVM